MGVVTTLGWQAYGDEIRDMIVSSYPQLGWLAPQSAVAETAPEQDKLPDRSYRGG
jgi:hypothetical protein